MSTNLSLNFTEAAVQHLQKKLSNNPSSAVRLSVEVAGCSGLRCKFSIIENLVPGDLSFVVNESLSIFVDPKAVAFINHSVIDYIQEGFNRRFKFTNPNEKGSCGCGESFYI